MLILYCTSINVRFYTRYSYHRYFRSNDSIKSYFIFCTNTRGTGIAEGLFVVLFSAFVPNGTVGIVAVAWRVVAEYLPFLSVCMQY